MPSSSFDFIQHENQGLCFDPTTFLKDSFSIDDFLRSHRNQTTLEVLRNDLGTYLKTLRLSMIELINKDYEDFVNLSKDLVGLNTGIEVLQSPLEQVRSEIVIVKNHLEDTIRGLKNCLEEERNLREKKQSLFNLAQVIESLKKVKSLLKDDDAIAAGIEVIERAASEYTILQFSAARCLSIMSIGQRNECEKLETALMDSLNKLFLESLRKKQSSRLSRCLRMYVNLDKITDAEMQVRKEVVSPFLFDVICESSLQSEPEGLRGIYRKVLEFVDVQLLPLMQVQAEGGKQFNFLLNSLWVELARRIVVQMTSVFSAGDPTAFHARYKDTTDFLDSLEQRLNSGEAIDALRTHEQTLNFRHKWNLLVYFKIRFQEVAGKLESILNEYPTTVEEKEAFKMRIPAAALMCLERCWEDEVYLPHVAHLLWKLALQIQARYCVWVKEEASKILMPDPKDSDQIMGDFKRPPIGPIETELGKDARLQLLISLYLETGYFKSEAHKIMISAQSRLPTSPALQEHITDTLTVNNQHLTSVINLVSDSIVALLVKQSVRPLVHVNDIPRIYRRTNREFPTKPCEYVNKILQPISTFYTKNKESVPRDVMEAWVIAVFVEVSRKFYTSIKEVLESAQKTEESLRRLKKVKEKSLGGTESKGVSDDDKIRQQLVVDVNAFCQGPVSLQVESSAIPMLKDLVQLVENARDKSERQ